MTTPETEPEDHARELFIVLSRAHTWISAHATRDIRRYGLNATEFGILELLYHKGPLPLQQIGEKILISSGNITYCIDKLASKQLLVRKPAASDRRVTFAELTPRGHRLLDEIFPQHEQALRKAMDGLSAEEQTQAICLLKKLGLAARQSF
ncbi:MAG TPA: MarR family transcriptional regulator [Ktedonobacteraceae bacterium]|jgi:MarR family 2-MHQ and catechol resistance regulon transcriptional repressor